MSKACPACGRSSAPHAAFCSGCGRSFAAFCVSCGAGLELSDKWCGACGAKVGGVPAPVAVNVPVAVNSPVAVTAPVAIPAPVALPAPVAPQPYTAQPAQPIAPSWAAPSATAPQGPRRSARRPAILASMVGLAAVAALVANAAFGSSLPWNATSIPLAQTPMDGATVIDVPAVTATSATVHPDGSTISGQGAIVVVPKGAVSSDTTLVIQRLNAPFRIDANSAAGAADPEAVSIGPAFDFGPAGTEFNQPVEVTLPFDPAYLPSNTDAKQIAIAYYTGTHWAVAGGKVDMSAHRVTVRLQSFQGTVAEVVVGVVIGTALLVGGIRLVKGKNALSDPVTRNEASSYVRPSDPTVKSAAAAASAGGVSLGDGKGLAALMATQGTTPVRVTLDPRYYADPLGDLGTPQAVRYDKGAGTNWQMPADYIKRGMVGDCTDTTNAMVSMFRSLGYQAKGVEGYAGDTEHPHAWGEVLIGNKPYMIDQDGMLQALPQAIGLNNLIRPGDTDPRNSMWDEKGQDRYKAQWWAPVALTVAPAAAGDAKVGQPFTLDAAAKGIGSAITHATFSWSFDTDVPDRTAGYGDPKDPLNDEAVHTFTEPGSYTVTVILTDTTTDIAAELARASVSVNVVSPGKSPSAAGATGSVQSASTGGRWVLVSSGRSNATNPHEEAVSGKISTYHNESKLHVESQLTWGPPPKSAKPGDDWTTPLSVELLCSDGTTASTTSWAQIARSSNQSAEKVLGRWDLAATCSAGSASKDVAFIFPDPRSGSDEQHIRLDITVLHGAADASGVLYTYGGNVWKYSYEWQG